MSMERFEKLADEFEDEWFVGNGPRIEDFLERVDQADRQELLKRLVRIEVEYRLKSDETIETINFDRLGPEAAEIVQKYVDEIGEGLPEGPSSDSRRDFVGPYRLVEQIGEGGMGSVFLADQETPVRRQVALKIIKSGLGGRQVLARFEAERQALAMMDHPNIAKILDAGTTEGGDPFFAMELVQGTPLTTYCDQHKLTVNARLEIFKQVCEGVQHAHQKGIIHRDLKPSNVMVAEYDGHPVPKVIDFGLAKALETDQKLTDRTVFTEFGQVLGTLKYMSPEQAGIDSLDVDTRSDVYALGVILFELLTGRTPLDSDSFKGMALLKILELVRELDSPRPSSQLDTTKKEAIEIISSQRKLSPAKLRQLLAGDLDWIVMKALEKDRNRRYDAVSRLAEAFSCRGFRRSEAAYDRLSATQIRAKESCCRGRRDTRCFGHCRWNHWDDGLRDKGAQLGEAL
jgi:serine/threonine protein kinase